MALLSFTDLPQDLLKKILSYTVGQGDPFTLLSCERTCRLLRNIVATDDSLWAPPTNQKGTTTSSTMYYQTWNLDQVIDDDERVVLLEYESVELTWKDWIQDKRFASNRERLCYWGVLEMIRKERKAKDNILVSELGVSNLLLMSERVGYTLDSWTRSEDTQCACLDSGRQIGQLRGDALFVLTEILQENLLKLLEHTMSILQEVWKETSQYPILNGGLFSRVLAMSPPYIKLPSDYVLDLPHALSNDAGLNANVDKMICRFVRRAGIPQMTHEVSNAVWKLLQVWTQQILRRAFAAAEHCDTNSCITCLPDDSVANASPPASSGVFPVWSKRGLACGETWLNRSPCSLRICTDCQMPFKSITIVPQQIQDAAALLGFPVNRVYGTGWLVREDPSSPFSVEQRIEMEQLVAEQEYSYDVDDDVSVSNLFLGDQDDFEHLLEDSDKDSCSWDAWSTDSEYDAISDSSFVEGGYANME